MSTDSIVLALNAAVAAGCLPADLVAALKGVQPLLRWLKYRAPLLKAAMLRDCGNRGIRGPNIGRKYGVCGTVLSHATNPIAHTPLEL